MATESYINICKGFEVSFEPIWSQGLQTQSTAQIYRHKYDKAKDGIMTYAIVGVSLRVQPRMAESRMVEAVVASFLLRIQRHIITSNTKTVQDALCVYLYICLCWIYSP